MLWQKIERNTLKAVRRIVYGDNLPKKQLEFISGEALNNLIYDALLSDKPFMVARFGSIELSASLYQYLLQRSLFDRYKMYVRGEMDFIRGSAVYERKLMYPLCNNAGFFPEDPSLLRRYSSLMVEDVKMLDCCCCCWEKEKLFADEYSSDIIFAKLSELEPYDYSMPWSKALEGKKVLVIHPFIETIRAQYSRKELLWENHNVLPEFDLHTIKAIQSIAGMKVPYSNWFDALEHMKRQMDDEEYDIAIIGCGAYGFHLAAHAKRCGKRAVHLGGATQILFGIKGKRWDNMPDVSKFYNNYWVYPSPNETPQNNTRVEGGCYW